MNAIAEEYVLAKYAVVVVDMLNDFVTGSLGCENAEGIVEPLRSLCNEARSHDVPVIFSNDSHIEGLDRELEIWGNHAMRGTHGAEVIPELGLQDGDFVIPKRFYSGFFQTDMLATLQGLGVDTLIITGLHTHMCCRHTSADAFNYGFDLIVPRQTTTAFTEKDYLDGLHYLEDVYGARVCDLDDAVSLFA